MKSPESALFTIYNSVYVNCNLILHSKILHTTLIFHRNSRANSVDTPFDFVCLFFFTVFYVFVWFFFFYGDFYNSQGEKALHHNKKIN